MALKTPNGNELGTVANGGKYISMVHTWQV